jgi:hypothetical protein
MSSLNKLITQTKYNNLTASKEKKYSPEDGLHGPKHVVSEWKEMIIKNFVVIDGHYNKVLQQSNL